MGQQRKGSKVGGGGGGGEDDADNKPSQKLQAILLADSFATKFRPITIERPKVLLPLAGIPMIEYSLSWLETAGVKEVFVLCCAHSKQVKHYLEKSQWSKHPNITVKTIESHNSVSAGDALRFIYDCNVINEDFVLITGDTVCNMPLGVFAKALQDHKDRKKKDSNAVMTMVIKRSKPSPITHQSRLGTDELFMAINPDTKQLLYYEDKGYSVKGTITLDNSLLIDSSMVSLHNDMQDCYIDICAQEILSLFADNFDYQHLRRDLVKQLLVDDIMGYKIHTHEIHAEYAAKVENFRSYDTICKDIILRWTTPQVPDLMSSGIIYGRQGIYRASDIRLLSYAEIGPFTLIGKGSTVGSNSKISNSIVGEGCKIGSNVSIKGSYIWNNVTIEDGCKLEHAIVCDGVVMKSGAVLEHGVILSFKVVIGEHFVVPAYSKVSLCKQPIIEDSDDELECGDNNNGTADRSSTEDLSGMSDVDSTSKAGEPSQVGSGGAGYIWSACEGEREEEWRHSVAPITKDKLAEISQAIEDGLDQHWSNDGSNPPSGELPTGSNDSNFHNTEEPMDDHLFFEKEVEATFQRAVLENIKEDNIKVEVNSLRLAYNRAAADCASAIFYSMMKSAVQTPYTSNKELYQNVDSVFKTWKTLLTAYLTSIDEEIEVILKYEEMCLESVKALSPLFAQVLQLLYDKDIIREEAILSWESEKLGADEADRVLLKQAQPFIEWLKNASEEESEEDEE